MSSWMVCCIHFFFLEPESVTTRLLITSMASTTSSYGCEFLRIRVGNDYFRQVDLDMPHHFAVSHDLGARGVFSVVNERVMKRVLD